MVTENLDEIHLTSILNNFLKEIKRDIDILYSILEDFHKYILIIQSDFFH